jgi:DNA-binding beta-propeller fold protein YncE
MQSHLIPFTIEYTLQYTLQHKHGASSRYTLNRVVQPHIHVGLGGARGIVFDPVNNIIYITNFSLNTIAIIYMNTNTVVGSPINVGVSTHAIAFDLELHRFYVTNRNHHTISVISTNIK